MPVGAAMVGASAIGGIASVSASRTASRAQQRASDQSTALQQQQFNQTRADNEPFRQYGLAGLGAIAQAYGLQTPQAATSYSQPSGPQGNNFAEYVQSNPDLLAAYQSGDGLARGKSIEQFGAEHYARFGQAEGRQLPQYAQPAQQPQQGPQTTPQGPTQSVQTPGGNYSLTTNADGSVSGSRPNVQPYQAPFSYAPRPGVQPFSYAPRQGPGLLDVSLNAFQNSGEYAASQNAYNQIADGTNSQFAANGALQSGAAAKALQDRAQANALNYYGQFRGAETNQFNVTNARNDANYNQDYANAFNAYQYGNNLAQNNYNTDYSNAFNQYQYGNNLINQQNAFTQDLYNADRSYASQQGQQRIQNLFNLAGYGQNANSANAAAGSAYANNASNGLFSSAAAQGNAALTNAANFNNLLSTGVNAFAYSQGAGGGGSGGYLSGMSRLRGFG